MGRIKWKLIIANLSLAGMLTSAYFTYQFHEPITRAMQTLTKRDVIVEREYFKDPNGLRIETIINEKGKQEIYLKHSPSGTRVPIRHDLHPNTESMLEVLLERTKNYEINKENIKPYLDMMTEIQKRMYNNL
jgi:hypothetical protein